MANFTEKTKVKMRKHVIRHLMNCFKLNYDEAKKQLQIQFSIKC